MNGKTIRINRLFKNNKIFCLPLDHGITNTELGIIRDTTRFTNHVKSMVNSGITSVVCHKGMVRYLPNLKDMGIIIHISASTDLFNEIEKIVVCDVTEAMSLGGDAISMHINLGNKYEKGMLRDFANVSNDCNKLGMPLLAMMYIRDENNKDISTPESLSHAIRIATELGADIVKVNPPQSWDYKIVKDIISDSAIPVIAAGGDYIKNDSVLIERTRNLMACGLSGVGYGRNVFLRDDPKIIIEKLGKVIFN